MKTLEEIERPKFEYYAVNQHGWETDSLRRDAHGHYVNKLVGAQWCVWLGRARLEPKWQPATKADYNQFTNREIPQSAYPNEFIVTYRLHNDKIEFWKYPVPKIPE